MALPARPSRRNSLPLHLLTLEDRTVPTVSFPDWTVGRYPFGWLGGEHVERMDLPATRFVANPHGYLTGPQAGHRDDLAVQNLREFAGLLDIPSADTQANLVSFTSSYADQDSFGNQHVYLRQTVNGLPVLNSSVGAHYTADGRLLTINGGFFPGLAALNTGAAPQPALSAAVAVVEGAYQVGYDVTVKPITRAVGSDPARTTTLSVPEASDQPVTARLAYVFSAAAATARPVWHFDLRTPDGDNWFDLGVDAQTGEVLFSSNWVDHFGTYKALALPNESPVDPTPGGQRTFEVNPFDSKWSPFGWHDTNGKAGPEFNDTRGNNVSAQLDLAANNPTIATPTAGGNRPTGGAFGVYDNPYDLTLEPTVPSQHAALVTNLFYMNNMLHDIHAAYGFTEAAGNFQFTNYSGNGLGGDQVNADAQDGISTDNANFATPPDGTSGRMQMFRFTLTNPGTDSDLENGIIAHELGHGVSNRLTGGPADANALNAAQSNSMGEGWSDFHALMVTQTPTDGPNTLRGMGNWVLGLDPATGGGIRSAPFGDPGGKPYSFDLAVNSMNFAEYGTTFTIFSHGPHAGGARWASALWDLNWLLIAKHGYDADLTTGYDPATLAGRAGNKLVMRLVMDGLKLQPANPSFIQARDAILQADVALTGGANRREIWTAFARRALGFGSSTTGADQTTAFTTTKNMPAEANNPGIIAVTPPGRSGVAPGSLKLTFSEAMNPASFDKSDITAFTGPGGVDLLASLGTFTWGAGNTELTITFTAPPGDAAQGTYALTLGPSIADAAGNLLDQDLDGTTGEPASGGKDQDTFAVVFGYDQTQLSVVGWTPVTGGTADAKLAAIDVRFSEPVDPASVSAADLQISQQGTVTGASVVGDGTTVRFAVAGLVSGPVYLQVKQAGVTDKFGFGTLTGRSDFLIPATVTKAALPVPLAAQGPLGSLSYQSATPGTGSLASAFDLAEFTIALDAGQTLNVTVDNVTTLAPKLVVLDPTGAAIGTASAPAAGQPARLLGATAGVAGTYTIQVASSGGTTGSFNVRVELNSRPEAELLGGAPNNTPAAAQPLTGFYQTAGGGALTTVVGKTEGTVGPLPNEVEPNNSFATANDATRSFAAVAGSSKYQIAIAGNLGTASGSTFDRDFFAVGTLNAGDILTASIYGVWSGVGTSDDPFFELYRSNGGAPVLVTTADDGGNVFDSQLYRFAIPATDTYFFTARPFNAAVPSGSYLMTGFLERAGAGTPPATGGPPVSDPEAPTAIGGNDTAATAVNATTAWRQVNYTSTTAASMGSGTDADFIAYQFTAGDLVTITESVTGTGFFPLAQLFGPDGSPVLADNGFSNGTNASPRVSGAFSFRIPVTGTYAFRAGIESGTTFGAYTITAFLSSDTAPPPPAPVPDLYAVILAAGDVLSAGLRQDQSFDTVVEVLDPAGTVVATSSLAIFDPAVYSNVVNRYVAPAAGTYYVRVQDTVVNPYTLTVATNAVLDREVNSPQFFADLAADARVAVGAIDGPADDSDWYTFPLTAGQTVTLRTTTPGDAAGEFVNALDPALSLYNDLGSKLATDDNSRPDGRNASITFTAPADGFYSMQVTAANGTTGEYVLSLPDAVNQPPGNVTAGGPYNAPEGQGVTLTASALDPDGDALTYAWDLDGDGAFDDAAGPTVALTAADLAALGLADGPFLRPVRVQVSDGQAAAASGPAELNIVNVAPTAAAVPPTVNEGSAGTFEVTGPADPSAADVTAGFKYAFDFQNDGTWDAGDGTYAKGVGPTATAPAGLFPDGPATFTGKARVIDKDGGFTDYTFTVTVANVAPTATASNGGAVNEGSNGLVRLTAPTDPAADDKTNGFRFAYDFDADGKFDLGDGTYTGSVLNATATVPAKYLSDGPAGRAVRLRILDKDGGFTDYTTTVAVNNVAPTGKFATGGAVPEGTPGLVRFTATADPSAADVAAGLRFAYDFDNDGVFDLGDGTYAGGAGVGAAVNVPTSFLPDSGAYTVTGRIIDKDGGFTDYSTVLTVTNAAPTATVSNAGPVAEGGTTTVTLSNATDPSPDDAAALRYAFDFDGDGLFDQGDGTYAGSGPNNVGTAAGKYFPDGPGTVAVRARVIDPDGGFTDYLSNVTVTNAAPTAVVSNGGPVAEGAGTTVTLSQASDPSPTDTVNGFRYAVKLAGAADWLTGDGTYAGSKLSPTAVLPAGLFPDGPGTVTLVARILDKDGGFTDYTTDVVVTNVAPTGTFANGGAVIEGQTGSVAFTAPADPSAADTAAGFRYAFDYDNDGTFDAGDGTYAGGVGATATVPAKYFADGGAGAVRTVRGRVLDDDGGFTDYTTAISVVNAPPTGVPTTGGAVTEGQPGTVSLTGASDPSAADQAAGLRFAYDFDNDGVFDLGDGTYAGGAASNSVAVPSKFLDDGPAGRSVRIRVIDKDGGFSQYLATVPVTNVAPTATFFNPGPVAEGADGAVTFAGVADPSAADTAAGFRYAYDFDNDGTFDLGGATYAAGVTAANVAVPAKYLADGPAAPTVRGRVMDKDGGFSEYTTVLTVTNVAPTATLGVTATGPDGKSVLEGQPAAVTFTGAADPSAGDTAAGFRYAFDYDNDGAFDAGDGTYAGGVGPNGTVPAGLLDSGPATRTVRGRVIDRDGGFSDVVLTLAVANVNPTATPVIGPTVTIGTPSTLSLTGAADPSAGDTAAGFTYSFDFDGDGAFEVSGGSPTASFTYPRPGVYPVGLRVSDRNGGGTSYTGTLAVNNAAPTAVFAPAGPVAEGGVAAVRFSDAKHPSADTTAAGFRYAFDLNGDGKFDLGDGTYAGSVANAEATLPAVLTAEAGTRTVRGRVIEVNGLSTDYTATVTVANVAPTATPTPPSGGTGAGGGILAGDPVTIGLTAPTDPSAADRAGLTYSFDFTGDGTFDLAGSKSPTATFAYPAAGSFTAVVRVSDPKGGFTDYPIPVTVGTPPPKLPAPKLTGYAVGQDVGGTARLYDDAGQVVFAARPFGDGFAGGTRVAAGDVNGDGTPDLIAGTGPGGVTRVVVLDGRTQAPLLDVQPFEDRFTGGVYVAAGDTDGDGRAEVVVTPDQGGGPVVAVYTLAGQQARFFGIEDENFRGGARAALGDLTGDGKADLLVAAGFGGGPRLAGFSGPSLASGRPVKLFADFFVFEESLRNGVFVSAGDLNRDGRADVVAGGGPGGGPRVTAIDGRGLVAGQRTTLADFFAGDPDNRDGVRVAVKDLDLDGTADVLAGTASPTAEGFRVRGYQAAELLAGRTTEKYLLDPFPGELGGVFVG